LGWDVQVRTYDPQADVNKQLEDAAKVLSEQLGISEEIALGLVSMGGTTVAVLNEFDAEDISENLNLSHEEAEEVMRKVREANNQ
jgi:N utilization substance protein A